MCGIAGIVSLSVKPLPDAPIAMAMCDMIAHRGPDDHGIYRDQFAQIGMRRLSIIDLAGGHQPIHNEDKSIWIVFNGEIYNFKDLRKDLEQCGHIFYTNTDTECIIHAYEEYGDEFLAKLRGMFAIAILDLQRKRLLIARDRLGKKPLYYTRTEEGYLAFASEPKSLFAVPGFNPQISNQATREYFSLGYIPGTQCIYEGVQKLLPAHYLVFEQGAIRTQRYWKLDFAPKWSASEGELGERLLEHLDDAVRVRLVSDVPFGAFLSGGLDSSIVAALMARHMSSPVKAFTIGFDEDAFNEIPDARRVARHIGAEHHELVVSPSAVDMLRDLSWYFDEPFGDSSSLPTFLVSRMAVQHVKMVLSGDGGDEAFAGYERYRKYMQLNSMASYSLGMAAPALRLAGIFSKANFGIRLGRIADRMSLPFPERYLSGVALATVTDLEPILSRELTGLDPYAQVRQQFMRPDIDGEMEQILSGDMDSYLVDDVLVKVDRMTMANSLEARAPLLDHVLLEFCARLPFTMKSKDGVGKYLLKQVAAKLLPSDCLQKRKQGFAIPLAKWFREDFKSLMLDMLDDRAFRERGIFNVEGVRACYQQHLSGRQDFSELLWLILTYETWARTYVDRRASIAHLAPRR